eukprot:31310-Pelagococcus_subviridis.AAC.6
MRYAVRARLGFSPTPSTMILARLFFLLLFERRIKPGPNATFAASYSSFRRSASALHAASSSGATFFHRSASRVVTCCISSRVNFASGSGCTSRMICARCLSQKTRYAVLARFGGCGRSFPFSSLSLCGGGRGASERWSDRAGALRREENRRGSRQPGERSREIFPGWTTTTTNQRIEI